MFLHSQGWNRRAAAKVPDQKPVAEGTISIFADLSRAYLREARQRPDGDGGTIPALRRRTLRLASLSESALEKNLLAAQWKKLTERGER
jgi:hypothetical protein